MSYPHYVYDLDCVYQKEGNCIIPTVCSWSSICASERQNLYDTYSMFMTRFCVSEKVKLYHTYNMFIFYILCIRKRETVPYLQYVHDLDFEYQKKGNCMIPTVCSWSRMCASERRKLYHTYSMFMFLILCIRKYQKEGNRIIPTLCLCSRFCVSERGKLYHTYIMFIFYILCIRKIETVSYLHYVHDLDFEY